MRDDDFVFPNPITPNESNHNILSFSRARTTNPGPSTTTKVLHRDIERKRRQEMSGLYASLRALLPLDRIKGKRSVCDHMSEAVNHINNMHKRIQELRVRRDKLRKIRGGNLGNCVVLNPVQYGVEVLISCGVKGDCEFGVSKVVAELHRGEYLSVVSCVSTRAKDRFLHQIQAEAAVDVKSLDLSGLQERLSQVVNE